MVIVHRRIFIGKVGAAGQLVAHMQEADEVLRQHGADFKMRIMTDYMTGRSDRVAAEWEADSLEEIDATLNRLMANPEAQAFFNTWLAKLNDLIHYSEAENWSIQ